MKKIILLSFLLISVSFIACKENVKKESGKATKKYSVSLENTKINWTAYKTSDKIPVNGSFTKIEINPIKIGASVAEALDGLTFRIPVSSLFTKDSIRDGKLKSFFFGNLTNTDDILGKLNINEKLEGSVQLIMNEISYKLPIQVNHSDGNVTVQGVLNLDNWKAQKALDLLNLACKDLHTGPDGVTKTWNEVAISVTTRIVTE